MIETQPQTTSEQTKLSLDAQQMQGALRLALRKTKNRLLKNRFAKAAQRQLAGVITHVETSELVAALSFDDGPHPASTPLLLDLLARHNARATFFMVGEAALRFPSLVRRVAAEGHAIGNHTWNHQSLPAIQGGERRKQIHDCQKAIAPFGDSLFRPPYGHLNLATHLDAMRLGYKVITWNLVAEDWLDCDPQRMAEKLVSGIKPGCIVCLHDAIYRDWYEDGTPLYDRQPLIEAVSLTLERLRGRINFLTVPELLKRGRAVKRLWHVEKNEDWKSLTYHW